MKPVPHMYSERAYAARMIDRHTRGRIHAHRVWYAVEGALFIVLGIMAMALPGLTVLAANFAIGALLLAGGLMRILNGIQVEHNRAWRLFSGVMLAAAGGVLLFWPLPGVQTLVIVLGFILVIEGVVQISMALAFRPIPRWGWLMVSGVFALALGSYILIAGPAAGIVFAAFFIGLSLILYGLAMTMLALEG